MVRFYKLLTSPGYAEFNGTNNVLCFDTYDASLPTYSDTSVDNTYDRQWDYFLCGGFGWWVSILGEGFSLTFLGGKTELQLVNQQSFLELYRTHIGLDNAVNGFPKRMVSLMVSITVQPTIPQINIQEDGMVSPTQPALYSYRERMILGEPVKSRLLWGLEVQSRLQLLNQVSKYQGVIIPVIWSQGMAWPTLDVLRFNHKQLHK